LADDGYTTILRTTDPAQGELVAEMLRREGIDARFHQVRSTMIGIAGNLFEMNVDVPTEREALARELIADLEYVGAAESLREEAEGRRADVGEDDEPAEAAGEAAPGPLHSRRHPLLAAGFAFFFPGGGHLYARRPWTALLLAIAGVTCLIMAVVSGGHGDVLLFFTVLGAIVLCDAVGGVRAARAEQKGQHQSLDGQLARGVGLLCLAGALGIAPQLASGAHARRRDARLGKLRVSCTTGSIDFANRGATMRVVDVWDLRVAASSTSGMRYYQIGPIEAQRRNIAPGTSNAVTPGVADWLARSCGFSVLPDETKADKQFGDAPAEMQRLSPRPQYCAYVFNFVVNAAPESGDESLTGSGWCVPSTPSHPKTAGRLELAP
jgi:hypothetical protein